MLGANVGMMAFKMSKPTFAGGKLGLQDRYSKGYGLMFGVCGGYEYRFANRWLLDVYFGPCVDRTGKRRTCLRIRPCFDFRYKS